MGSRDNRKFAQLDRLVQLLLDHPAGLTRAEIARRLGVHRSTAASYIDSLEDIDVPVYEVTPNRFAIDRDNYRVTIRLNMHESLALHLASRLLTTRTDKHYPQAASALRKLGTALEHLAPLISQHIRQSADLLDGDYRHRDSAFLEVLETLTQAWSQRRLVRLTHAMEDGQTFAYQFAPYFIEPYAVGRTMHVIGYRTPPGAVRTFKIERIRTVKLLAEQYTIPPDFDPTAYLKDAWGIWISDDQPRTVVLRFSPQVAMRVRETQWHHTQQITEQDDGSLIWRAQIAEPREMLPWIRGWGADCEVLEPSELRNELEREAKRLATLYAIALNTEPNTSIQYYAHSRPTEPESTWQLLKDHLTATGELAAELGSPLGIAELARVAGLLHDIGKYSQEFQARLRGSKRRVDHATAGAKEIIELYRNKELALLAEMVAFCIAGHHTGLPDYGSPADLTGSSLQARLKKALPDYSSYQKELDTSQVQLTPRVLTINRTHSGFTLSFLVRMLFSVLVDADWLETERFMQGQARPRGHHASIETLAAQFNRYLERFENPQTDINRKRTETLKACRQKARLEQGFFTLTVPTGGGKTLASMAFALNHAVRHNMKRVIYVLPFTSIIEQNADVFRQALGVLGAENVLEHHSNYDWEKNRTAGDDETNQIQAKLRLAAENWDIPIVVTTNVQFFESLFASQKSRARKIHNIANSVIVFDEVQLLPRDYLKPCMLAVQELVQNYHVSAVFCTATQPALHRFFPKGTVFTELAPDPQDLFSFYRRVQVKDLGSQTDDDIAKKLNSHAQALCIVNTRRHARGLFDLLQGEGKFHLSTLMCPTHRRETLEEIRHRLTAGLPCRVVSTSVMEAGIDVDFPVGYRALAGLDSIIQAAGRVNRERKQPHAEMFVFTPDTPHIKRIPAFIQQTGAVARSVLRAHAADPTTIAAIENYYETLYTLNNDRAFDAQQVIPLLDKGPNSVAFSFAEAAGKFRIISQNTVAVIIPYDDTARELIAELENVLYPTGVLRRLQAYTVNIYEREFENLQSKGVIYTIAENYHVLDEARWLEWYHLQTGLRLPDAGGGDAIFFDG
ncbi:MAG: hypothetical protein Kow0077_28990 [Anaerolineae bacterium]